MTQDYLLIPNGHRRRIRRSFSAGNDRDDRGWTMLHVGARKGDLKEVKKLLDEGMDANVAAVGPKSHGVTPLHLAAKGGHVKVMDELLERGANIDARTKGACGCKSIICCHVVSGHVKSCWGINDVKRYLTKRWHTWGSGRKKWTRAYL